MRKLLLLITALLTLGVSGAWADSKISKAVAGTYLFDSNNPALTVNKGGATITSDNGAIIIHHDNLSTVSGSRTYAAVVMKVAMPTTATESFSKFISLKPSNDFTGSIGLGVTTDGKLKGTWGGSEWNGGNGGVVTSSAVTGEHTIVLLCNDSGTTIYVDDASTSANNDGLKCSTKWTDLRIESAYASCVKSVYVFSGEQKDNISDFFSELSNVVTVANSETKSVNDNSTATRFFVASGGTLTADVDYDADLIEVAGTIEIVSEKTLTVNVAGFDLTKITGEGNVTLDADATISKSKSTVATGKLTINEGKTLTLGAGQSETNSIESFTSIELAGTIKHNNSVATLKNVTVPENKTGKIFAYDMGSTSDGFKLAGTTTLNGNLTVCNKYNFQMKVDNLAGSGTWLICGTTGNAFNAEGTASNEKAIINVAAATTFTGTINLNNVPTDSHPSTNTSQVTVQGNLVGCTLQKTTGDYFYYSGASLDGTTLDGVILSGTARINTSNTVNIKNLAGNNLNSTDHLYAFVGGGTINFYGVCDLTKKSDGTVCNSANIGYGSSANVKIKAGANVTAGVVLNSSTISSNAPITVEETATLTAVGSTHTDNATLLIYSTNLSNNGTVNLNADGRKSIVSALSGSGTLNVASGSSIEAPSVPSTMTLTGAGDVVLTSFPSSTAPTLSSWTGAIEFPEKLDATNITDILNAWGNENSTIKLNNLRGYFSKNTTPVNPTLNILENKTLTINNGYSDYPPTLSKLKGKGDLNISWGNCSNTFNLTIQKLLEFDGTLATAKAPIYVTKLVLETAPAVDDLLIKTSCTGAGTVTLKNLYINSEQTTAYSWETKTVDEVNGIYVSALDQVQQNRERAVAAIAPYFTYIGSGVGKYTVTLGSTPYTNTSDLEAAILGWATIEDCADPIIAINQPTSAFYRIKSGSKYLQDVRKSDSETQRTLTDAVGANESAETIFYLNDNTFVGYKTGFGFGFSVCQTRDTEHLNTQLFTESAEMGKYTIQSQQGTYASANYNEGFWGIDNSDLFRVADAASGACWTIESVTTLPVTFKGQFASFYSPVDLEIPEGVKVYTGTLSGDKLILSEITTGTLPHETGVILEFEGYSAEATDAENTKEFNILSTSTDGTSDLLGATAAQTVPENSTLVLGKSGEKWGIYKYGGTTLGGFKAYMEMPATPVKGFTFTFGDADAIANVLNGEENVNEVYDLSGRRVNATARGLYIVNGKKVVIK